MVCLYAIFKMSQLFDFHHLHTKKMTHNNISTEQKYISLVNFINIDIFLSSWYEIMLVRAKTNSM